MNGRPRFDQLAASTRSQPSPAAEVSARVMQTIEQLPEPSRVNAVLGIMSVLSAATVLALMYFFIQAIPVVDPWARFIPSFTMVAQ